MVYQRGRRWKQSTLSTGKRGLSEEVLETLIKSTKSRFPFPSPCFRQPFHPQPCPIDSGHIAKSRRCEAQKHERTWQVWGRAEIVQYDQSIESLCTPWGDKTEQVAQPSSKGPHLSHKERWIRSFSQVESTTQFLSWRATDQIYILDVPLWWQSRGWLVGGQSRQGDH